MSLRGKHSFPWQSRDKAGSPRRFTPRDDNFFSDVIAKNPTRDDDFFLMSLREALPRDDKQKRQVK